MTANSRDQVLAALQSHQSYLIVLPPEPSIDACCAGISLMQILEKREKRIKIISESFESPKSLSFLSKISSIEKDLKSERKFIIQLDLSEKKIGELNYDIQNDKLNIFITPEKGIFEAKDVQCSVSDYGYEAIIILDAPDLEHLGAILEKHADLFYQTPIINIDNKAWNQYYGQINYVDVKSPSLSEIIMHLSMHLGDDVIHEDVATSLLAGILNKTKNFQVSTVTPRTLSLASQLMTLGANRDVIMKNMYHSKSLPTLKLWGRVLARLQADTKHNIVWSLLQKDDFMKSQSQESDLHGIIDELIVLSPEAEKIAILYEDSKGVIHGIIHAPPHTNALEILADFSPKKEKDIFTFSFQGKNLREIEAIVLKRLLEDKILHP